MTYYPAADAAVGAAMSRAGITHAQLALRLGMSDRSLREKRLGRRPFTADEVAALARAAETTPSALLASPRLRAREGGVLTLPRGHNAGVIGERRAHEKRK